MIKDKYDLFSREEIDEVFFPKPWCTTPHFCVFDEEIHEEILVKAEKKRLSMREGTHLKSKW